MCHHAICYDPSHVPGNLVSCDCSVSYLYSFLHSSSSTLTPLSLHSAVCATPPALTNAPLYQLASSPQCDPTTDLPGDYYYTYEEDQSQNQGNRFLANSPPAQTGKGTLGHL